jgi:hypothetical protein
MLTFLLVGDEQFDLRDITWETNLWWSDETPEERAKLGEFQGGLVSDQVIDVDPRLDDELHPQNPEAQLFGAFVK